MPKERSTTCAEAEAHEHQAKPEVHRYNRAYQILLLCHNSSLPHSQYRTVKLTPIKQNRHGKPKEKIKPLTCQYTLADPCRDVKGFPTRIAPYFRRRRRALVANSFERTIHTNFAQGSVAALEGLVTRSARSAQRKIRDALCLSMARRRLYSITPRFCSSRRAAKIEPDSSSSLLSCQPHHPRNAKVLAVNGFVVSSSKASSNFRRASFLRTSVYLLGYLAGRWDRSFPSEEHDHTLYGERDLPGNAKQPLRRRRDPQCTCAFHQ